jgi:predicted metalloendopeptidase
MALLKSLVDAGQPTDKIDGFTPEQRFFLGWGQIWCQNQTDEMARMLALNNEHSPGNFRVSGVVQNMPEFQKAWGCKASQPMVRANACHVW